MLQLTRSCMEKEWDLQLTWRQTLSTELGLVGGRADLAWRYYIPLLTTRANDPHVFQYSRI